jgi:hypothetical protein
MSLLHSDHYNDASSITPQAAVDVPVECKVSFSKASRGHKRKAGGSVALRVHVQDNDLPAWDLYNL